MVKVGKWIAKHRILMLIIGFLLIIPSVIGMAATKVNYDLLSYLPEHLETVKGQDILVDEYGMGAFSMVVVENMEMKDVQKLEEKFEQVNHVKEVLWYDDVADISVPVEMIPEKLRKAFYNGDATMMLVLFDNTTSSDDSMEAIEDLRKIANEQCFIGGMTGVVTDIKNVALKELPVYVVIAAVLSLVVIELTSTSFVVPILFLLSIGLAILYNLGSNVFLGETSYITKALTAVLQLGFNLDFAPVADVNSNPNNTVIGSRAFGTDPEKVAEMVAACVKGFRDSGMVCTLKHFPGHGDTEEDSHYGEAKSWKTLDELRTCELRPFQAGIEAGASMIMVGHITLPNVTEEIPATLSHDIVTGILREEMKYNGIIITDSMAMNAIANWYSSDEAAVKAIQAGCDMILMPYQLESAVNGIETAVNSGDITEERIEESVLRILKAKLEAGIIE